MMRTLLFPFKLGGIALLIVAAALTQCASTYSIRQKLTIALEVDGEIRTASSVVQHESYKDFLTGRTPSKIEGEALYLDLGEGRKPLIALLSKIRQGNEGYERWTTLGALLRGHRLSLERNEYGMSRGWARLRKLVGVPISIGPKDLPSLVTFRDLSDPMSVELVDPDDLEDTLGSNVRWHSMSVEVTEDPISAGLVERLPWLHGMHSNLDGLRITHVGSRASLANTISSYEFIR